VAIAQHLVMMGREVAFIGSVDGRVDHDRRNFNARGCIPASTSLQAINKWTLDRTPVSFYEGRVTYFAARENVADRFADNTSGWSEIALGGVDVIEVGGSHHSFEQASGLGVVGPLLSSAIELALARPEQWARALARPDPERAFRLEARLAAREGDLQRELAACQSAFQVDPKQPVWFMRHHAEALAMAGNGESAIQAAHAAVARDPWPLASLVLLAPTMQKLGERDFLQRMRNMADVVPTTHPSVEVWRASAYAMIGLGDLAEQSLLHGLAEEPKHLKLRQALSGQYSKTQRFAEAAAIHHSIVRDYPSLAEGWRRLGYLHLKNGDPGAALEALQRAKRLRHDDPKMWQLLSRCLDRLDRKDEAREARERAASLLSSETAPVNTGWNISTAALRLLRSAMYRLGPGPRRW
jgi:Flp pilus assembly protein TadD